MSLNVNDWSTAPNENTAIDGVNIDENCSAGGINNAIRSMMAAIATFVAGIPDFSTLLLKTGGAVTGNITRDGLGPHRYSGSNTFTTGREDWLPEGAALPTAPENGHVVVFYKI